MHALQLNADEDCRALHGLRGLRNHDGVLVMNDIAPISVTEAIARRYVDARARLWGAELRAPLPIPPRRRARKRKVGSLDRVPVVLIGEASPRRLVRLVALRTGVTRRELMGKGKSDRIAIARHLLFWLLSTHCDMSSAAIGRMLGRDHTTILWGLKQHEARRGGTLLTTRGRGPKGHYIRVAPSAPRSGGPP
jgi:hypothetical protein